MKILYVITGLGMGGAENVVKNLSNHFKNEGCHIKIVYFTGENVIFKGEEPFEIVKLNIHSIFSLFSAFYKFRNIIIDFEPDVIHSHMVHANIFCRLVRLFCSCKRLISTAHSSNEGGRIRMLAYRLTHRLSDVTTNVSTFAVKEFESKFAAPKNHILAIPNGVDVEYFKPNRTHAFSRKYNKINIVSVGRLELVKDYPTILKALRVVKEKNGCFHLSIVGDGTERKNLELLVRKLGLSDDVSFLGIRKDLPEILNNSDLFIMTSKYEGFGLVIAEAMACGLPVITTDNGGATEIINDNENIIQVGDHYSLAEKIIHFYGLSTIEKEAIGNLNRGKIVNKYTTEIMYAKYTQLYKG
ncbi:TPA: glycosyltransferase [Vibrio vulnificus]|nr:glycosyltransferase [Vibrio vulnificus]